MLILVVIAIAVLVLSAMRDAEDSKRERRAYEEARDEYIARLRLKYAGTGLPSGYRATRRVDFTGEEPLTLENIDAVKREIVR